MFNWIGLHLLNYVAGPTANLMYNINLAETYKLPKIAKLPTLGMEKLFGGSEFVTIAVPIALLLVVVVMVILYKTKFGYEIRATGFNKEAAKYGEANVVASSKDESFSYIPKLDKADFTPDADYFHITTNNTIYGTEIKYDIDCPVPLIADMSSDIMSRPVDVTKYAMIYGGAQKNVGPAGVTFFIVKKDLLGKVSRYIPTMLDLRSHIDGKSMYNTPPVFSIFVMNETLKWLKGIGGVEAIQKVNQEKAALLYGEIDRNPVFKGTAVVEDRSLMNVCFVMAEGYEHLQDEFMAFAKAKGMTGIKGHRSVGGFRASIYNACPLESVQALVDCMKEFEELHK